MNNKCFFCHHDVAKIGSRTEVKNGEARQITEYECTNPSCSTPIVVDEPYDF